MELGFSVQLHHEAILHRQLLLHPLSHENQVPVRQPSPWCFCHMVANPRLSGQLTTLPSTHSKSNTSSGPACFSVSSSITSSGSLKSCGHSPSSSRPSPFSHNYSCCNGQERRKPLRPITLPLWERTGPSTSQIGYTGTCGGHSLGVASFLTGLCDFRNRWYMEDNIDIIAVLAGLVQTGLYADFFYIYFTK